jgi:cobalt-zinc-cadmium efflux system membrane fusion protein
MYTSLRNSLILSPAFLLLALSSCRSPLGEGVPQPGSPSGDSPQEVRITREQFQSSGMRTGGPEPFTFRLTIAARGYVSASPAGQARISSLIPGRVKDLRVSLGGYVQKGAVLFTLECRDLILLQQEYASAIQELESLKAQYERQKTLSEEEFASRKSLAEAESSFLSLTARTEGLKAQLKLLRLDPGFVEQGNFYTELPVRTPVPGYVTQMDVVLGQYLGRDEEVMEIVNTDRLQLELNLYERNLPDLAVGQVVRFHSPDDREKRYEATLSSLGRSVDPDTRTVTCLAEILPEERPGFVHRQYMECSVVTCEREAAAIPDDALIEEEGKYFVLTLEREDSVSMYFRRVPVEVGVIQQEHAEILDKGLEGILLEGVYDLPAPE